MDGVSSVTQRGAGGADRATNASTGPPAFLYDFTARDPGAYWWHAHFSVQYADGLRGMLFVEDPVLATAIGGSDPPGEEGGRE